MGGGGGRGGGDDGEGENVGDVQDHRMRTYVVTYVCAAWLHACAARCIIDFCCSPRLC